MVPQHSYKEEYDKLKSQVTPAMRDVIEEREKQDKKWGVQNHDPLFWNAILGEEFGEVSKAILEEDEDGYREELVQVAAVAIAALESLDRKRATRQVVYSHESCVFQYCPHPEACKPNCSLNTYKGENEDKTQQ